MFTQIKHNNFFPPTNLVRSPAYGDPVGPSSSNHSGALNCIHLQPEHVIQIALLATICSKHKYDSCSRSQKDRILDPLLIGSVAHLGARPKNNNSHFLLLPASQRAEHETTPVRDLYCFSHVSFQEPNTEEKYTLKTQHPKNPDDTAPADYS